MLEVGQACLVVAMRCLLLFEVKQDCLQFVLHLLVEL
jgi:hypothetical protein